MADDVLVDKLFNFICGSGGFVKLSILLRRSSPLGSRKSETEARNWLKSQTEFALVKDGNGEVTGVRIALKKKICQQYALKGSCRKKKGMCKHWHICKKFVEGKCIGVCELSHDFHSEANGEITKELQLQRYSNGALKNIVAWSLPQVCQLYLKNECKADKCTYIHVCSQAARGSSCSCSLSHDLADSHNMKILKEYDLVPSSHVVNVAFVRCSVLVLGEERCVGAQNNLSEGATAVTSLTVRVATVTAQTPTANAVATKTTGASNVVTSKTTTATAATSKSVPTRDSDSSAKSGLSNGATPTVLFDRLCKEFNCSAPLPLLQDKKVVISGELEEFLSMLEENQDKFLVTRNVRGTVQGITAFCPKLRLCLDFVALNKCKNEGCPYFHLCRKFITGACNRAENCGRSHYFRNKRDNKTLLQLKLDGLTNQQLRQLMLLSTPQVCINYNKGKCTDGSYCSQVHICKKFVTNACINEDRCRLNHKRALDTQHTRSLLDKYVLDSTSCNNVLKNILICEEQDSNCTLALTIGDHDLPTKGNVISGTSETAEAVTSTILTAAIAVTSKVATLDPVTNKISTPAEKPAAANVVPRKVITGNAVTRKTAEASSVKRTSSSQRRKAGQPEGRSSVSSSCSAEAGRDEFSPSKKAVFDCISKQYDGSVSFAIISKRQDLLTGDSEDVAAWFRERQESFLLTEDRDGSILQVTAFCPKARLCFDYLFSQNCSKGDCQYFHVCREHIAGYCRFGSRCKWHHNFQFDENRGFILKLELDGLTHEQLRKVLQLSMPQVCLDYNDGCCKKGLSCTQIHICKDFVKKKCEDEEDCGLQHENALVSSHASAILENYGLRCTDGNFKLVLKELIVCDDSSRQSKQRRRSNSISQPNNRNSKVGTSFAEPSSQIKHQVSSTKSISDPQNYSSSVTSESNGSSSIKNSAPAATPCFPTERQVFESLCTEYHCSASFKAIAKRTDLFPHGLESAESWFRRTKGNFLITDCETGKGKISQVEAFSTEARLCLTYIDYGLCQKPDCKYFHVCKNCITDSCSRGASCPLNHHFYNNRDKALLSRVKFDLFTELQLRKLVLLSSPQLCVEYNNGICSRGNSCHQVHICCGYLRKSCSHDYFCGLDHERALNNDHNQAVFQRLQLSSVRKHDVLKIIFDDKRCLSSKEKTNCK